VCVCVCVCVCVITNVMHIYNAVLNIHDIMFALNVLSYTATKDVHLK